MALAPVCLHGLETRAARRLTAENAEIAEEKTESSKELQEDPD
jgi:hypothetical protein